MAVGESADVWKASHWTTYLLKCPFAHPIIERILMERYQGSFWK